MEWSRRRNFYISAGNQSIKLCCCREKVFHLFYFTIRTESFTMVVWLISNHAQVGVSLKTKNETTIWHSCRYRRVVYLLFLSYTKFPWNTNFGSKIRTQWLLKFVFRVRIPSISSITAQKPSYRSTGGLPRSPTPSLSFISGRTSCYPRGNRESLPNSGEYLGL